VTTLPPEALEAARRIAEQAPPFSGQQRARLAALLAAADLEHRQGAA
jgi:hypothetical protein